MFWYRTSLAKHTVAKNALQILFNSFCKMYNTILITTSIKDKAEKESWIHLR